MSAAGEDRHALAVAQVRRALRGWRKPAVLWPTGDAALPLTALLADVLDPGAPWRVLDRGRAAGTPTPEAVRSQLGGAWRIERIAAGDADLAAACAAAGIDGVIAAEAAPAAFAPAWLEPLAGWDAAALHELAAHAAQRAGSDAASTDTVTGRLKLLGYL